MLKESRGSAGKCAKVVQVAEAVGTVLAHDITEVREDGFKGQAFRKGHVISHEDVEHLKRLGKEHLFILDLEKDEIHEDDAACMTARALIGEGVKIAGTPCEGKVMLAAKHDGLLKIRKDILLNLNMLGEVICSTLHDNTIVKKEQTVAAAKVIPLVINRNILEKAVAAANSAKVGNGSDKSTGMVEVKELRKPKAGIIITGNEVYGGSIKDVFGPRVVKKIMQFDGEIIGFHYAPDDKKIIKTRLEELIAAGADILITTGGMSVDPDDLTRGAIKELGTQEIVYGSPVLPGAMFLIGYYTQGQNEIPVLGVPAGCVCSNNNASLFDVVLPRVLAGEKLSRKEIAELGHGGLCMKCAVCRYPVCPFCK